MTALYIFHNQYWGKEAPAKQRGRELVILGQHQRSNAGRFVRISRVFGTAIHIRVVVVAFPKERPVAMLEA